MKCIYEIKSEVWDLEISSYSTFKSQCVPWIMAMEVWGIQSILKVRPGQVQKYIHTQQMILKRKYIYRYTVYNQDRVTIN